MRDSSTIDPQTRTALAGFRTLLTLGFCAS